MELIKFDDMCIISRANGYDEDGAETTEVVYSGPCNYQQGVQTYQGLSQRNSLVVLAGDVRIWQNDLAVVTESNGTRHECQVKTVRNVKMPLVGTRYTRLEMQYDRPIDSISN